MRRNYGVVFLLICLLATALMLTGCSKKKVVATSGPDAAY